MSTLVDVVRRVVVLPQPLWWSHNDHYHGLMLSQIPAGASRALDIGCGTGAFARKLATRIAHVDAIDRSSEALTLARDRSTGVSNARFVDADLFDFAGDERGYDFISLIAVVHHMDFDAAAERLRSLLAPDGVVAILGIAREDTLGEFAKSTVRFGVNAVVGAAFALRRSIGRPAPIPDGTVRRTGGARERPVHDVRRRACGGAGRIPGLRVPPAVLLALPAHVPCNGWTC